MNATADVAASPASFQPLNAHHQGRCPQSRRGGIPARGCIEFTVASRRPTRRAIIGCVSATSQTLRAGERARRHVLRVRAQGPPAGPLRACRTSRSSCATAAGRSRPARSGTRTCSPGTSSAATSSTCAGGWTASGTSSRSSSRVRPRRARDPAVFLPVAYRDLDELDGFLEHLAREVHDRRLRGLLSACWATPSCARLAAGAVHAQRAPRVPGRPARAHGGRGHARPRGRAAAPAADSDLLICAALLHDLGKTREFTYGRRSGCPTRGGCSATWRSASRCSRSASAGSRRERAGAPALRARPPRAGRAPGRRSAPPRRSRCTG